MPHGFLLFSAALAPILGPMKKSASAGEKAADNASPQTVSICHGCSDEASAIIPYLGPAPFGPLAAVARRVLALFAVAVKLVA